MTEDTDGTDPDYADYVLADEHGERPDLEVVGVAGGSHDERPRLYDPATETAYKGQFDHENERIVVVPDSGRDVDESAIGIEVEMVGDWEWLSPYAREHVDDAA